MSILSAMLPAVTSILARAIPDTQARADALRELHAAAASIVALEARGNWLQRSWRPLMMLFFAALVGARWFGFSAPNMSEAEVLELWGIVKLGLGGYTIGRTAEKITPAIADAIKGRSP